MFRLEVLEECGSTNEELFARRDEPGFPGLALLALKQRAGHGRRGREWWSAEGNLALSMAFRARGVEEAALMPFRAGIAVAQALAQYLSKEADIRLKWPNDIYINGRKIAGLLSQARQSGEEVDLVLGIGLNLKESPPGLDSCALSDWVPPPSPVEFARSLLAQFEMVPSDFASLKTAWERHARIRGAKLTILEEGGECEGMGLLSTGELEVRDASGRSRRLSSETISLRFA